MDVRWTHPFTCVIAGPTQSGKTEFVKRFVRHVEDMVTPVPTKIIWSYGEWQPAYQSLLDKADFVQGLPDLPLYSAEPLLLVIDDQMHGVDQRISSLFTKGSHHRNLSVIYIVQNLFDQHKEHRTISLNAHYLVIFKNPRDGSQIVHLSKQMYPGKNPLRSSSLCTSDSAGSGISCGRFETKHARRDALAKSYFPRRPTRSLCGRYIRPGVRIGDH